MRRPHRWCEHTWRIRGLAEFTEQTGDFFLVATGTEVFALRREGFEEIQTLVFSRRPKQLVIAERANAFADAPRLGRFDRAAHPENKHREPNQGNDP